MNVSITIPQLFYDLLARVIPGFLFLLMVCFELSGANIEIIPKDLLDNSIVVIVLTIAYLIISYLMGWVLVAFTFLSDEEKVKKEYESLAKKKSLTREMYHRIRIKNEAVGFRILKLRAEARMLESSRMGMIYILIITLGLLLLDNFGLLQIYNQSKIGWVIKFSIPLILTIAFWKCRRRAWDNYYGNIVKHYEILFRKRVAK